MESERCNFDSLHRHSNELALSGAFLMVALTIAGCYGPSIPQIKSQPPAYDRIHDRGFMALIRCALREAEANVNRLLDPGEFRIVDFPEDGYAELRYVAGANVAHIAEYTRIDNTRTRVRIFNPIVLGGAGMVELMARSTETCSVKSSK